MTRRLLLSLFLALAATVGYADVDRDVLLTSNGTLYTIESDFVENFGITAASSRVLKLTIHRGDQSQFLFVPASLTGGYHSEPALAHDPDTDTLFVFWQRMPTRMGSELLFSSFSAGQWSPATVIDTAALRFRMNLRIAVTRYIDDEQTDGSVVRQRGTIIHAVWWEQTGYSEDAKYAMLSVDRGQIVLSEIRELMSFIEERPFATAASVGEQENFDFLRHPAIFELPGSDAVEVVFADWKSSQFYTVEVRPRKHTGVLRPPIGRSRGIGGPRVKSVNTGRVSLLPGPPGSGTLAFYFESGSRLNYVMYTPKGWSELQSIAVTDNVTIDTAVNALRKLLASQ